MLIDSDVLIWLTRGNQKAHQQLSLLTPWRISTITYLELAQGCRNKQELARIKQGLEVMQTIIFPITPSISECAMSLVDSYALSHGLQLADALIAATALEHQITLLTGNTKHFVAIEALKFEHFKP
ncbi:MAG: type II toxin-antitoxin system VapC family toxin [Pseudomonadales bacterium]